MKEDSTRVLEAIDAVETWATGQDAIGSNLELIEAQGNFFRRTVEGNGIEGLKFALSSAVEMYEKSRGENQGELMMARRLQQELGWRIRDEDKGDRAR